MLFLVIAVVVGWSAKRIWPMLVLAAVPYGAIVGPINMMLVQRDREWFGQGLDWSVRSIAINIASAAGWFLAIGLVTFGVKTLVHRAKH